MTGDPTPETRPPLLGPAARFHWLAADDLAVEGQPEITIVAEWAAGAWLFPGQERRSTPEEAASAGWRYLGPAELLRTSTPQPARPIPLFLTCPSCGERHVDEGRFAEEPHHTHACQHCGLAWRPALVPTVGVRFLPGFRDEPAPPEAG